jgi:Ca-activated chloride channel family protein
MSLSKWTLAIALVCACAAGSVLSAGRSFAPGQGSGRHRPEKSLFQSEPGKPDALGIAFDRQTQLVTLTLSVEDPDGYFIPNLRPENFTVYEDGVLQKNATVDVDHAAVSLSLLVEGGSRYQELNQILRTELPRLTHPLIDALMPDDKLAVFSYTDMVKVLADVDRPRDQLDGLLDQLPIANFAETNLYDALVDTLNRTQSMPGRRALLLISTGLDSFSHATFDDVVAAAKRADTPVYCVGLGGQVQRSLVSPLSPLSKVDWSRAGNQLKSLAQTSNGRTYLSDSALDTRAIYDDLMEHLRVRYVIKYTSSATHGGSPRQVRVVLVDPRTGGPLRIIDAAGKAITARISAGASYTP